MIGARKALRIAAPLLLLLTLTACSDKKQASEFYESFAGEQQPGIGGAIKDATGLNGNTPEVRAALDAAEPILELQNRDVRYETLVDARASRDPDKVKAAFSDWADHADPREAQIERARNAVELGQGDSEIRLNEILDAAYQIESKAIDRGKPTLDDMNYCYVATLRLKESLANISKSTLSRTEKHAQALRVVRALKSLYHHQGDLERLKEPGTGTEADAAARTYELMEQELMAGG